jgi:riboflavin kinase/FMN adenylyltransferase
VLHPEAAPKLITPFAAKRDIIEGLGVGEIVVIPFDREFSELGAEDFISKLLVGTLGANEVSVGENFRFGAKAKGSPEMLAARDEFSTRVVPLIEVDGETVSSTRIRALVAAGDVEGAMACLGAPFLLEGEVVSGDRRGRTLGFPTANIAPVGEMLVPGHGVYAAFADGLASAVNVGVRPTFETGRGLLVETYIIDQDVDLYGQTLRVAFIARLRGERRFGAVEDLIAQMHLDVVEAKKLCATFTPPA